MKKFGLPLLACWILAAGCNRGQLGGVYRSAASGMTIEFSGGKATVTAMGQQATGSYIYKDKEAVITIGNDVLTAKVADDRSAIYVDSGFGMDTLTKAP